MNNLSHSCPRTQCFPILISTRRGPNLTRGCAKALVYPYQSSHLAKAEEAARPYPPHNLAHVVGWHFTKPMMLHCSSAHLLHRTPQRTDRPTDVFTTAGRNGQLSGDTVDPRLGPSQRLLPHPVGYLSHVDATIYIDVPKSAYRRITRRASIRAQEHDGQTLSP
jgi:hypothetical protein